MYEGEELGLTHLELLEGMAHMDLGGGLQYLLIHRCDI